MEKQNHPSQKLSPPIGDEGQKEGGTKQFSPPAFQLMASNGEENNATPPLQLASTEVYTGIPNLGPPRPPQTPQSSAKQLRDLFDRMEHQQSVGEHEVGAVVVDKDRDFIDQLIQAYAAAYHSDLIQDLYRAMNAQPQKSAQGLYVPLAWILRHRPDSDPDTKPSYTLRDGGEDDLLMGHDHQSGTNHLRVEGPAGSYSLVGQPFQITHAETASSVSPKGSTYRPPAMERAIVGTPDGKCIEMKVSPNALKQGFTFTPPAAGIYEFQCYIRHQLAGGKTHVQIISKIVVAKTATEIASLGLQRSDSATLGETAMETYRAQMELQAIEIEKRHPQHAAAFKQYLGQLDATIDHFQPGTEAPVQAALTLDQARQGQKTVTGATQPLVLYLGKSAQDPSQFLLADLSAMARRREYYGSSLDDVFKDFKDNNKYERGAITLKINPNKQGYPLISHTLETGGRSWLESTADYTGWASVGLSLAGLVAAFVPGLQLAAPYLLLGASATGAISSTASLADQFKDAEISPSRLTLDIISLVSSIIGGATAFKAIKAGAGALQLSASGNLLLYTDVTLNGSTALVMSLEGVDQINGVLDSDLSRGEKIGQITRILAGMAASAGLFALSLKHPAVREAVMMRDYTKARMRPMPETFGPMAYSETDVRKLMDKATALDFTQKEIEDLLFVANRDAKRIAAEDLMEQMEYVRFVQRRGFPSKFRDMADFSRFHKVLARAVEVVKVPTNDMRIQGSAVRNPFADDVDIAVMLPEAVFDDIVLRAFNHRLKENKVSINMDGFTHADLQNLLERIQKNPDAFNGQSKDFEYVFGKKMINSKQGVRKAQVMRVFPASIVLIVMKQEFPHLNIQNVSFQTVGGRFDLHPYLPIGPVGD